MITTAVVAQAQNLSRFETAFVRLVDQTLASPAFTLAAIGAAFAVGAFHALTPGHGKAVAAAYLVGGRGRPRDAVLLGIAVAAMHTVSVLVLGLGLQLWLRRSGAAPATAEDVTPALRIVSGIVVVGLGIFLVVRQARARHRPHEHDVVAPFSRRGLVLLGMSGGLLPSPAAFLVLLTASLTGRLLLGLVLVGMFSIGLATTLTLIGLAVVRGRAAVVDRVSETTRRRFTKAAAVAAAVAIVAGGLVMTTAGVLAL